MSGEKYMDELAPSPAVELGPNKPVKEALAHAHGYTKKLPLIETERCSGNCCERFNLPYSPEEFERKLKEHRSGRIHLQDIEVIQPLLVYLGMSDIYCTGEQMRGGETHFYTCKHYDKETHNCGIYDKRPRMCSEFPYPDSRTGSLRGVCPYPQCTRKTEREQGPEEFVEFGAAIGELPAAKVEAVPK